jgi:hypothetical protein
MAIKVIIMPKGSTELHPDWHDDWPDLTTSLVRRAASGDPTELEVFLCLLGSDRAGDNRMLLEEAYAAVRSHTWHSNLYLAVDPLVDTHPEQMSSLASRRLWLQSALRGGVDDILLVPLEGISHLLPKLLRNRADASEVRRGHLPEMISDRRWHGLTSLKLWGRFLETFVGKPPPHIRRDNFLIAVEKKPSQLRYISEVLSEDLGGQVVIGYIGAADKPVPDKLSRLCADRGLKELEFGGLLELDFFLIWLNHLGRGVAGRDSVERVQAVRAASPARFSPPAATQTGLLIGSSFDPGAPQDCLAAAQDAGILQRDLSPGTKVVVHPALSCHLLPELLQSLPPQIVLVLLGHGKGADGLQEFSSGKYLAPQRWLEGFSAYDGSLPLAFFSSCRSIDTARLFAEAGAGVAIGFAADVLPRACQRLAELVVQAALRAQGDRHEILRAYQYGCRVLKAEGLDGAHPMAFYSER